MVFKSYDEKDGEDVAKEFVISRSDDYGEILINGEEVGTATRRLFPVDPVTH